VFTDFAMILIYAQLQSHMHIVRGDKSQINFDSWTYLHWLVTQ